jgi:hypothetical protein
MVSFPGKAGVMKKIIIAFAVVCSAAAALRGQDWTEAWARWHRPSRLSIGLHGGSLIPGSITRKAGSYQSLWDALELASVHESADLELGGKSGYAAGFSLEYFGESAVGLQLLVGFNRRPLESTSETLFSWRWRDGRNDHRTSSWAGSGSLTTIPVALNGVIRLLAASRLMIFLSGGIVLNFNELRDASSTIVWGFTRLDPHSTQQWVDALAVPVRIEKTDWLNLGLDAGLSFEAPLGPSLRMVLEARYYHQVEKTLAWTPIPVEGDGLYFSSIQPLMCGVRFEAWDAAEIVDGNILKSSTILPSLFQVTFGLKLRLVP